MKNLIFEITIPVLNEEKTLKEKIEKVLNFFKNNNLDNFSLVISDNGSKDDTQIIGQDLEKRYSKIKYIRLNEKGVGLALQTSWQQSKADIIGYMDLDLSTDLKHILTVKKIFEESDVDIVNGSRLSKDSIVIERKRIRTLTSKVYNFLCRIMTKTNLNDYSCGFKFINRIKYEELLKNYFLEKGWFFTSQILILGLYNKFNIKEIGVKWVDDPNSSINISSLSIYYIKNLIKIRKELK